MGVYKMIMWGKLNLQSVVLSYNLCGVRNGWWYGNKKGVGETGGIWWKDKADALASNVNIEGRNISKYENNSSI